MIPFSVVIIQFKCLHRLAAADARMMKKLGYVFAPLLDNQKIKIRPVSSKNKCSNDYSYRQIPTLLKFDLLH